LIYQYTTFKRQFPTFSYIKCYRFLLVTRSSWPTKFK